MKQRILFPVAMFAAAAFAMNLSSCKKADKNGAATMGTFYFHIHSDIDTNEVEDAATLYADASGRHFGLSMAKFYISGITLKNADGTDYTISTYVLKTLDSEEYYVGTAPVGTYTRVTFNIGVDASKNTLTQHGLPVTDPLGDTTMCFNETAKGYKFMKILGFADTSVSQTGLNLAQLSYEIGNARNLKTITLPTRTGSYAPYILTAGGTQYIHLVCDYGRLLSNINFKTQDSTDTYSKAPGLADSIANNFTSFISYEE